MGGDFDYNEPAWLSERRATRSLAKVKEKAKHEDPDGYGKRLLKLQNLYQKFALPETEDEYSPHSDNEYVHSEEEYDNEEESHSNLQRAWNNASENYDPENEDRVDEDNQYTPKQSILPTTTAYSPGGISSAPAQSGPIQQNSKPAPIRITPGRGKCMMTCMKCGKRSSKTEDIVAHRCDHTAVPPPQKARSCRPKQPTPERAHHSPPNYLDMGGIYLGPLGYDASYEKRVKDSFGMDLGLDP